MQGVDTTFAVHELLAGYDPDLAADMRIHAAREPYVGH